MKGFKIMFCHVWQEGGLRMKSKNLVLVLAMVVVFLMSFGIVAHAETTTGDAREILLTNGEMIFEANTVTVLEEGMLRAILEVPEVENVKEVSYIFDTGMEDEKKTIQSDEIKTNVEIKEEFEIGSVHTLYCKVLYTDGSSLEKTYTFKSITRHENSDKLCMNVRLNNVSMYQEHYYTVKSGDRITIDVETFSRESTVCFTGYYWADADTWERLTETIDFNGEDGYYVEVEIPEEYYGTRKTLMVESVINAIKDNENTDYKSGWQAYNINLGDSVSISAQLEGRELYSGSTYSVRNGDTIVLYAKALPNSEIDYTGYYFAEKDTRRPLTEIVDVAGDRVEISLPDEEVGTEVILYVEPVDKLDDGRLSDVTKTGWQKYYLVWQDNT